MEHQLSPNQSHGLDSPVRHQSIPAILSGSTTFVGDNSAPSVMDDLAHEVRQPLSVIESLAYYLEITSPDEKTRVHLQRIQAMVVQADLILKRTCRLEARSTATE